MKFSIVVCTYNSERFLSECLQSIERQTNTDFEVIVVDGYSSDKTLKIVSQFKLPTVRIVQRKPKGISAAMNIGYKNAKGDYVLFIHSDDRLNGQTVLDRIDRWLRMNPIDWAYGKIKVIDERGKRVGIFPTRKVWLVANRWILKYFNYIPHQAVVMKRSILKKAGGFDESLKSQMDYDLWLRLVKNTGFKYMDICVSNFRIHEGATSSSSKNRDMNQGLTRKVQRRHLSDTEYLVARLTNYLIEKMNRMYR